MKAGYGRLARNIALAAALLCAGGWMAAPAFAQSSGGTTGGTTMQSDTGASSGAGSDSSRMMDSRAPRPGETEQATVSVPLLWPECQDVRGQSRQMVECLNRQQLREIAQATQRKRQ